jgi:hypothetical protein
MSVAEFADVLNCDAIAWEHLVERHYENVETETVRKGNDVLTIRKTPVGELRSVSSWRDEVHTWHPTEFPVKSREDYETAMYIAEHTSFEPAQGVHEQNLKATGDRGVVMSYADGTPLMAMLQGTIGMPEAYYHMNDYPQEFDRWYEVEVDRFLRYYEAYARSDAEYITIHENTSSTLVSPDLYRKYCLPAKKKMADIVKAAGKVCVLHMCGTLMDLMPDIKQVGADCWESFTPPPNGDTYFEDGRQAVGDDVSLVGGMNAVMLTLWPESRLLDYVDRTIDRLPHTRGIVFTSGGAMPIECPLERLSGLGLKLADRLRVN